MAFFWLVAAWVKSRAERPSVSVVNRQLHVQIGCKLGIRNRKDELQSKQSETNYKLDQKVISGVSVFSYGMKSYVILVILMNTSSRISRMVSS